MSPSVEALVAQARSERQAGNLAEAADLYRRAARAASEAGDLAGQAHAIRHVADLARQLGDPAESLRCAVQAVEAYRTLSPADPLSLANALRLQALVEPGDATPHWREARDLYAAAGVEPGVEECDARLAGS